jgi:hypothetical protein
MKQWYCADGVWCERVFHSLFLYMVAEGRIFFLSVQTDTSFSQSLTKSCTLTILQISYYNGLKQVFELLTTRYANTKCDYSITITIPSSKR